MICLYLDTPIIDHKCCSIFSIQNELMLQKENFLTACTYYVNNSDTVKGTNDTLLIKGVHNGKYVNVCIVKNMLH